MREALHAITDELRRLKTAGVKTVAVSDESLAALRKVVVEHTGKRKPETGKPAEPAPEKLKTAPPPNYPTSGVRPPVAEKPRSPAAATLPPAPTVSLPAGDK